MSHPPRHHAERERFFGAAKVIAALTMLSRVLGLVRDMVIVPLGGPRLADAFWTAFSVPNLFRRLFGEGALSAAFVPVFTDATENAGPERARQVLANVAGLLALVLAGLTLAGELVLATTWVLAPGDWARQRLIQFTALMLPFMFTVCLLALGSAALNCRGHFAYPAASPILLNVGLIVAAGFLAPNLARSEGGQFFVIGLALVVTGVFQVAGVAWLLRRYGLGVRPRLRPLLGETRRVGALMAPMLVPLAAMQLSAFADRIIAWAFTATEVHSDLPLRPGVVRCLYAANRLYMFPLGVLAVSIATAVFPLLSRYAARGDVAGLREVVNRALRLCVFLGVPAGVGLIVLSEPLVALIYQRRGFTVFDADRAAGILQMYCLGMPAYFCRHILLRAFFSRGQTRAPLVLSCILAPMNVLLVLGGIFTPLRGGAIGLATAITCTLNTAALLYLLRRRLGPLGARRLAGALGRTAAACAAMLGAIVLVRHLLGPVSPGWLLLGAVPAGVGGLLLAAVVLRCPELGELLGRGRPEKSPEQTPSDPTSP